MDEHDEKIWLKLDAILRQLLHVQYWITSVDSYHPNVLEAIKQIKTAKKLLEGK